MPFSSLSFISCFAGSNLGGKLPCRLLAYSGLPIFLSPAFHPLFLFILCTFFQKVELSSEVDSTVCVFCTEVLLQWRSICLATTVWCLLSFCSAAFCLRRRRLLRLSFWHTLTVRCCCCCCCASHFVHRQFVHHLAANLVGHFSFFFYFFFLLFPLFSL